jgi:hypothetical protein
MYIHNWYHSNVSIILLCTRIQVAIYVAHSPCFFFPLADSPLFPLCSPFQPLVLTWNPPSCDRIRPPRSQVACKLTSPVPTLFPTLPPPNSQNPNYPRLTKTTSGTIRLLLSGTLQLESEHPGSQPSLTCRKSSSP